MFHHMLSYLVNTKPFAKVFLYIKKEGELLTTAPYPSVPFRVAGTSFTPGGGKGSHCSTVASCPLRGKVVLRTERGLLPTISTFAKASTKYRDLS